ncbi:MAG: nucleotide-binding protein [Candidatus Hadarchaeaceae archaeon]
MKICLCGKGGSGKSTVVTLLTFAFKNSGRRVIVLDSDESNASLFWMLGFDRPPYPLMDFLGGKKKIQERMITQFSKGGNEPVMSIWEMDNIKSHSIPSDYMTEKE